MKYAIILGDGMSDWKIPELKDKTCLEAAKTPYLDKIAPLSEVGLCKTVPDALKPGSDVANMSVLGFDPEKYYTGRSPLEAVSMGIALKDTDVTVRCNLVTLSDEEDYAEKTMLDYSAGDVSTEEAEELIACLKESFDGDGFTLYSGISYRHCLVAADGKTGNRLTPQKDRRIPARRRMRRSLSRFYEEKLRAVKGPPRKYTAYKRRQETRKLRLALGRGHQTRAGKLQKNARAERRDNLCRRPYKGHRYARGYEDYRS